MNFHFWGQFYPQPMHKKDIQLEIEKRSDLKIKSFKLQDQVIENERKVDQGGSGNWTVNYAGIQSSMLSQSFA